MILIVGTRSSLIKNGNVTNVICPKCKEKTTLRYSVYSKYTHLTLIPLFPVGKEAIVLCDNCNEIIEIDDLDDDTITKLASENNNLKNPIWMFFGSFLLALVIIYGIYSYFKSDNETEKYIQNPTINDVYSLKDSKGFYYTFRIDRVTNDSVYATENDYQVEMPYEIEEVNQPKNYTKNKVNYSKKELENLYKENKITAIIRN